MLLLFLFRIAVRSYPQRGGMRPMGVHALVGKAGCENESVLFFTVFFGVIPCARLAACTIPLVGRPLLLLRLKAAHLY